MKAIRYRAPGDVRLEEAADPEPGDGDLLVRMRACSVCGTDLKIFKSGHSRIRPPRIIGHEIVGEVAAVGRGLSGWTVGDRVQVVCSIPCGECSQCHRGRPTLCTAMEAMGYHYDGGFADYLLVPRKVVAAGGVNRLPDGLGFAEASVAEPLACVVHAQQLARVGSGDVVVVVGSGPSGCLHARLARHRGAARVVLVGRNPERLALAASLVGPDEALCLDGGDAAAVDKIRAATDGGPDVVITAVASAAAQVAAVQYAAPGGRVSFYGSLPPGSAPPAVDTNLLHYRELSLSGSSGASPRQNAEALELIATGAVPVADLITARLPIQQFFTALELIQHGKTMKVTIVGDD